MYAVYIYIYIAIIWMHLWWDIVKKLRQEFGVIDAKTEM